jgi:hypothetical protein
VGHARGSDNRGMALQLDPAVVVHVVRLARGLAGDALWASISFLCAALLASNRLAHGLLGALETIVLLSLAWEV